MTKYEPNYLQALGECLGLCETRNVDARAVAQMMLDLVVYNGELKVPVYFLDLPEAPQDEEEKKPEPKYKTAHYPYARLDGVDEGTEEQRAETETDERDEKGRKVIKRDHDWREKTLRLFGNCPATSEMLSIRCHTSKAAMSMRLNALKREGKVEQCEPRGYWRVVPQ